MTMTNVITGVYRSFCDAVYQHPKMLEILRRGGGSDGDDRDDFDVIVMEPVGVDCASALARALDRPLIYAIPSPVPSFVERAFTGHVSNPASVSHIFARHAVPRTFAQRCFNAVLLAYSVLRTRYDQWMLRSVDPRPYDYPSATVRPAVIFQNTHDAVDAPRPLPSNVVGVGGIHLKPAKTLPTVSIRIATSTAVVAALDLILITRNR